jgi:hypothetical protein
MAVFLCNTFFERRVVMNRISRNVSAAVLCAALLVTVSPAAQARTPERRQAPRPAVSWLDMAVAWLGDFVIGTPRTVQSFNKTTTYPAYPISGGIGLNSPMTSSGLDPNGSTHP